MVKTKDELLSSFKSLIGERDDDDTIQFLEDFSDTVDSFSKADEWRRRYEENDKEWRERYRARFFDGGAVEPAPTPGEVVERHDEDTEDESREYTYEELFEKKEM